VARGSGPLPRLRKPCQVGTALGIAHRGQDGGDPRISELVSQAIADAAKPAVGFAGLVVTAERAPWSLLVPDIPLDAEPGVSAREDEEAVSPSR